MTCPPLPRGYYENEFVRVYELEEGEFVETRGFLADFKKNNLAKFNHEKGYLSISNQYIITLPIERLNRDKAYMSLDNIKGYFADQANEAIFCGLFSHYVINGKAHNKIEFNSLKDKFLGDGFDFVAKSNKAGNSKAYLEVDFNKANLTGKFVKINAHFKRTDGKGHTAVDIFVCLDVQ